jgi:ketopantoate reductase
MLLDAEKGRPMEVEVILGEVVRMAREKRVPVPVSFFWPFSNCELAVDGCIC